MSLTPLESHSYTILTRISRGIIFLRKNSRGEGFAFLKPHDAGNIFASSPFIGFPVGVTGIDSNITNCVGLL